MKDQASSLENIEEITIDFEKEIKKIYMCDSVRKMKDDEFVCQLTNTLTTKLAKDYRMEKHYIPIRYMRGEDSAYRILEFSVFDIYLVKRKNMHISEQMPNTHFKYAVVVWVSKEMFSTDTYDIKLSFRLASSIIGVTDDDKFVQFVSNDDKFTNKDIRHCNGNISFETYKDAENFVTEHARISRNLKWYRVVDNNICRERAFLVNAYNTLDAKNVLSTAFKKDYTYTKKLTATEIKLTKKMISLIMPKKDTRVIELVGIKV